MCARAAAPLDAAPSAPLFDAPPAHAAAPAALGEAEKGDLCRLDDARPPAEPADKNKPTPKKVAAPPPSPPPPPHAPLPPAPPPPPPTAEEAEAMALELARKKDLRDKYHELLEDFRLARLPWLVRFPHCKMRQDLSLCRFVG